MEAVSLLLSDSHGVYIPANFVEEFGLEEWGIDPESWEVQTILQGPKTDGYWDAWGNILDHAEYHADGNVWRLYQDGDLWAVCPELMDDEEKRNFGFDGE